MLTCNLSGDQETTSSVWPLFTTSIVISLVWATIMFFMWSEGGSDWTWWKGGWMKRWFKITSVCSLAVLDSSLKSRCQQGCVHPGGFLESISLFFQLPEPPTFLVIPPSYHSSLFCPHVSFSGPDPPASLDKNHWLHQEVRVAASLAVGSCLSIGLRTHYFSPRLFSLQQPSGSSKSIS